MEFKSTTLLFPLNCENLCFGGLWANFYNLNKYDNFLTFAIKAMQVIEKKTFS